MSLILEHMCFHVSEVKVRKINPCGAFNDQYLIIR